MGSQDLRSGQEEGRSRKPSEGQEDSHKGLTLGSQGEGKQVSRREMEWWHVPGEARPAEVPGPGQARLILASCSRSRESWGQKPDLRGLRKWRQRVPHAL